MTLAERLNEQLSEKEEKIEELEERMEKMERDFDLNRLSWQMHRAFEEDKFYREMPYPRLEMRLQRVNKDDWYSIEWHYGLVYKHFSSMEGNMLLFVPFGLTTSNGGRGTFENWLNNDGKLDLPFRDGVHIRAEAITLGLPAYIICKEKGICERIDVDAHGLSKKIAEMRSPERR